MRAAAQECGQQFSPLLSKQPEVAFPGAYEELHTFVAKHLASATTAQRSALLTVGLLDHTGPRASCEQWSAAIEAWVSSWFQGSALQRRSRAAREAFKQMTYRQWRQALASPVSA